MQLFRVVAACLCLLSAGAQAQERTIPGEAKGGEMRHLRDTLFAIDGVERRLAPGVQIRDAENRLVFPDAVRAGAQVKYLLDHEGQVRRVWILTPEEAKRQR
jgi:hypothetical protein